MAGDDDEKQLNPLSLQFRVVSSVQHKMFKELKRRLIIAAYKSLPRQCGTGLPSPVLGKEVPRCCQMPVCTLVAVGTLG